MTMLTQYTWQNTAKRRYYKIFIQPDMLNEFVIICNWGSQITRRGNCRKHAFQSQNEAVEFVEQMLKRRARRGYELLSPSDNSYRALLAKIPPITVAVPAPKLALALK